MFRTIINHQEYQYINLISRIVKQGKTVNTRNGKTRCIIGANMNFDLDNSTMPILTTKKVAWRTCLKELFWFINGNTSNTLLKDQNVKIWNDNASREFLDSRGLYHLKEDDLGPVYGHQWRYFNATYTDSEADYSGKGADQLQYIIDSLNSPDTRYSRRLIMSAWNPIQINEMALPPCHVLTQFNVLEDELHCSMYQRSGDVGLGVPFNIASYSFLTHIIGKMTGLKPTKFHYHIGNAHIYEEHISALNKQILRRPYNFPTIEIANKYTDIEDYTMKDIKIKNYKYHEKISMDMKA
tara:strand:- start:458 stop:1345 length:888 start_codon:yes stop_codon:yes gene_type:complete